MTDPLIRDGVEILLERVARWPADALNEFFALMGEIEAKYNLTYKLSDNKREAILRSLEDVKAGRFASDEEIEALFGRFEQDK